MSDFGKTSCAYVFQGAGVDVYKSTSFVLNKYKDIVGGNLDTAEKMTGLNFSKEKMHGDDLLYYYYTISCSLADIYDSRFGAPKLLAGYSVGVFSALYYAKSISFEEGISLLMLLSKLLKPLRQESAAMAVIIGINENDFGDYSSFKTNTIDLINKNNDTSYVFSGESSGISELISEAEIKGAYITKILPINIPYHSRLTHGLRRQWEEIVNDYVFSPASLPIIDTHKQSIVCSAKDCRNLAINSFCHAFSWYGSLKIMASLGITNLYECGPGLSLSKIGEFTDLGHTYVNIKSLKRSC